MTRQSRFVRTFAGLSLVALLSPFMINCAGFQNPGGSVSPLTAHGIQIIKQRLLQKINQDRAAHGLQPVALDSLASAVGDAHCREAVENNYVSHFRLDGMKPYHHYCLAGGYDFHQQNIGVQWWSGYKPTLENVWKFVLETYNQMISEKPPNDGHRRNILTPEHNRCGIGLAVGKDQLVFTQEFLNHYVVIDTCPPRKLELHRLTQKDTLWVAGHSLNGEEIQSITVFYEPLPKPMSPAYVGSLYSYSFPEARKDYFPRLTEPDLFYQDGSKGLLWLSHGSARFRFPLQLWKEKPGIYTLVIWLANRSGHVFPATNLCFFVYR